MDTATTQPDRRDSHRTKVDLLINRFLDGHPYMCRMTDISRTGARLIPIIEPSRAPRFMGLQFQLPGTEAVVTASGEAVTTDATRAVGVRFTNMPPDSVWAIEAFLKFGTLGGSRAPRDELGPAKPSLPHAI